MVTKTPRAQSLTVAVDGRSLNRPHVRGIGRYLLRVLQSDAARGIHWIVFGDRPDLPVWISESDSVSLDIFDFRGDRFHAWEQIALPAKARMASADVLFCPAVTGPAWQPLPTVVTLHDIIQWLMDEDSLRAGPYRDRVLPRAFHAASAILTPSHNSARDIIRKRPSLEAKTQVVPNGVDAAFLSARPGTPPSIVQTGGARCYVLYVGGEIPRKRLDWAIDVWRRASDGGADFVACGVNVHAHAAVLAGLEPDLRSRVHLVDYVSDAELAALYANAAVVLYPTLYEGFGLPALEAQACGTPVMFSAVGSLTELAGPGAVVLPVDDKDAWVAACRDQISRSAGGTRPNEAARSWAAQFTWASSAGRVVDVLYLAAGKSVGAALCECAP